MHEPYVKMSNLGDADLDLWSLVSRSLPDASTNGAAMMSGGNMFLGVLFTIKAMNAKKCIKRKYII